MATSYGTTDAGGSNTDPDVGGHGTLYRLVLGQSAATLTVVTHVINDDGGTAVPSGFTIAVTGGNPARPRSPVPTPLAPSSR